MRALLGLSLLLLASIAGLAAQAPPRDWENPAVFERNQLRPHASLTPFESLDLALASRPAGSDRVQSLNGEWKFQWAPIPEEAPAEFYREGYDDGLWPGIQVPGCWQMQGFGYPKFRNVHQPFPADPPRVPSEFNPVGSYRRTFFIPADWNGREVVLRFEGVKSAAYIWINGKMVGYNEGGMEPAEFRVTPYIRQGANLIAVQVFRFSDGTYLEDQDMWRLSGIFRDVTLVARPSVYLRDLAVVTDFDASYQDARLSIDSTLVNHGEADRRISLRFRVLSDGESVVEGVTQEIAVGGRGNQVHAKWEALVSQPRQWSAEKPNLYRLVAELVDERGSTLEAIPLRFGFREVEIRDQQVLINGRAVKFNGVNSHMHHPDTGRAVDPETMRKDLVLMKQFNVNLVRTSHYPPPPAYLELADELGMYIIDETGDEAHATEELSEDPAWRDAYVDRARQMVFRDRNHPSVIIWSAGNESGSGDNICALIAEGKRIDPSRPGWMYGGNNDSTGDDPNAWHPTRCEDIVGPRYPTPRVLEEVVAKAPASVDPRPSFMDEYISVAGNGLGGLDEYWNLIWRYPRLTGGAIWDWVSPGIREKVRLAPDTSPRQNDGILMGRARLVVGRFGNALSLSGQDDFLEVYRDPALDIRKPGLTLDFWVYPRKWTGHGWFLNKGEGAYGLIQKDEQTLLFYIQSDGNEISAEAPIPAGWSYGWHRLSGVYDGTGLCLYIDGNPAATRSHSGPIDRSAFAVNVGRKADMIGQEHDGYLVDAAFDNVRIYARALTEEEISKGSAINEKQIVLDLNFDTLKDLGDFFSLGIGARSYGLVWPDRVAQPELQQLKKSPQPISVAHSDSRPNRIRVTNRFGFTNLSEFQTRWTLYRDERKIDSGELEVSLAPGESREIDLPFSLPTDDDRARQDRLLVQFLLSQATPWAGEGHEVAWEEIPLNAPALVAGEPGSAPGSRFRVMSRPEGLSIEGGSYRWVVDPRSGSLKSLTWQGRELIVRGLQESVFRPPVANEFERSWGEPRMAEQWFSLGIDSLARTVRKFEVESRTERAVVVRVETELKNPEGSTRFRSGFRYRFLPDGGVSITHTLEPEGEMPDWLGRVGVSAILDSSLRRLTWFGRGPFETWPDRKSGAKTGVYSSVIEKMYEPYLIPQDYGNRTDVRWGTLTADDGVGLFFAGTDLLNVSAHDFATDNLYRAEYPYQLKKGEGITLNVDHAVSGVGCTAIKTLKPYRVLPQKYEYTIYLRPFNNRETPPEKLFRNLAEEGGTAVPAVTREKP